MATHETLDFLANNARTPFKVAGRRINTAPRANSAALTRRQRAKCATVTVRKVEPVAPLTPAQLRQRATSENFGQGWARGNKVLSPTYRPNDMARADDERRNRSF